jgi:hypothetical protein
MAHNIEPWTEWPMISAACWGSDLGAVAVIVHEVRSVLFGDYPIGDPFVHVMTEMVVAVPCGALLFAATAGLRNWLLRTRLE